MPDYALKDFIRSLARKGPFKKDDVLEGMTKDQAYEAMRHLVCHGEIVRDPHTGIYSRGEFLRPPKKQKRAP